MTDVLLSTLPTLLLLSGVTGPAGNTLGTGGLMMVGWGLRLVFTKGTDTTSDWDWVWAVWIIDCIGKDEWVTSEVVAMSANVVTGELSFIVEMEVKATTGWLVIIDCVVSTFA